LENSREIFRPISEYSRLDFVSICSEVESDPILESIAEALADYSALFAKQNLAQQEADTYNDTIDLYNDGFETAENLLGPPDEHQKQNKLHTVEGMNYPLISEVDDDQDTVGNFISLASAGEAAVSGVIMQAVADSDTLQDDYAYYINDGVYGAFNNLMFDHATIRPRVLHVKSEKVHHLVQASKEQGLLHLDSADLASDDEEEGGRQLFASTIFGPTCDSIDVVSRSVLLPKLKVGDWLYFQNMGAYTMAAASSFNGFTPTEKFYVCSVQQKFFNSLIFEHGEEEEEADEKKED
jgi:hypothetical protein